MRSTNLGGLNRLAGAIEELRSINPELPAQTAMTFLVVALNPGLKIGDIGDRLGVSHAAASRNVGALGSGVRGGAAGLNLIATEESPEDSRAKVVNLTSKGMRLAEKLAKTLEDNT